MSAIESWLASAVGRSINPDGHYGLQCVDVADDYAETIFGVPWQKSVGGVAGARQLLDAAPDEYWIRIDYAHGLVPQRGDVLVYAGDKYNEWGHTAVVESADQIGINVIQQDGFAAPHQFVDGNWYSNKPAHRVRLAYRANGTGALAGWLRPRPEKVKTGTIQVQAASTITPITPTQEDEVSAEDVFTKKLTLKNGAESTFENQVLNISDDLSKVLTRLEEDRDYAQKVNGKIDALFNLLTSLPAEIMDKPITTTDGKETTLATELKWLPANFAAAQDVK